ncbi:M10 family metallopeptidase C-terminal domain-containing protein [Ancylothrix sp. C2]|uniref:M10 family metallopeptidase n=1 Tax=Ancylothrix sp. D3o TaxID=2953691 RepID=UPI0021BBA15C|nr:M10 family metallopeptidase [Ancylothrix sp. D3o]MCT7951973.1 M10 family metallopeptidase C-terminal domain-containing protein [Ancylothrix sp. D3o]
MTITFVLPPIEAPIPEDFFDADFYRIANPDLAGFSEEEAFNHFDEYGLAEGRRFSPVIDLNFYRANNSDLQEASNRDLLTHLNGFGLREGRSPSPFFDFNYYRSKNPDLVEAGFTNEQLFSHYLNNGIFEGRNASPFFDLDYYRLNNPDVATAGLNNKQILEQYIVYGTLEGRRASLIFDPSYYLGTNRDLVGLGYNFQEAFQHYVTIGQFQGRQPSLFYDQEAIDALIYPPTITTTSETVDGETVETTTIEQAKWDVPKGGTLTYSFVTTASSFLYAGTESAVGEVSDPIKQNVRQIMQRYQEVLPFNIVEVPDRPPSVGQIRIMFSEGSGNANFYAYAYIPGEEIGGDIHLSRNYESNSDQAFSSGPGTFGYESLVHEIGHALGLKHPNNYTGLPSEQLPNEATDVGPFLSFPKDNNSNTVMSYNFGGAGASSPMPYDVRALQILYGSTGTVNNGDTVHQFNSNTFLGIKQTLWDSGGIDALDFARLPTTESYYFDMNEGGRLTTTSALNGATYIAYGDPSGATYPADLFATIIGYGVTIENLYASPTNDIVLGNNQSNIILGLGGADRLTGARRADLLTGGPGVDTFIYSPGDGGLNVWDADVITDFTLGEDTIGLSSGLTIQRIRFLADGADTLIQIIDSGEFLTRLQGIQPATLTANDFTLA